MAVAQIVGEEVTLQDPRDVLTDGTVILMDHPRRVCRIEGRKDITVLDKETKNGKEVTVRKDIKVVVARAVIPSDPMPGFVEEDEAVVNRIVRRAILARKTPYNDVQWEEQWDIRAVSPLKNPERSPAMRDDEATPVFQLYCRNASGRDPDCERNSPVIGLVCTGSIIPNDIVPDGLFMTNEERSAEAERIANEAAILEAKLAKEKAEEDRENELWKIKQEAIARFEVEQEMKDKAAGLATISAEELEALRANQKKTPGRKPTS